MDDLAVSSATGYRGVGRTVAAQRCDLLGQTVVITGGSSGIGLATARSAKSAGGQLIITDRHAGRLEEAADELGVEATAAFDDRAIDQLTAYLARLPMLVDHLVVSLRNPCYAALGEIGDVHARQMIEHLLLPVTIAGFAAAQMPAGASLLFLMEIATQRPGVGQTLPSISAACMPVMIANLALETLPVRVNLIATRPASGILTPDAVASLATHLMINSALTGATYDLSSAGF